MPWAMAALIDKRFQVARLFHRLDIDEELNVTAFPQHKRTGTVLLATAHKVQ